MTRILNKMNSLQEISDTQEVAAVLGLTVSLCSEIFKIYDAYSYINFVLNEKEKVSEENMVDNSSTFPLYTILTQIVIPWTPKIITV